MVRTFLTFVSDIPDNAEWGPGNELLLPAGKKHIEIIAKAVSNHAKLIGEPWNEEDFGWEFLCRIDGFAVSFLIQQAPEWLVIIIPVEFLKSLIPGRRNAALRKACAILQDVVSNDSRFCQPRWFTRQEYEAKDRGDGSPKP